MNSSGRAIAALGVGFVLLRCGAPANDNSISPTSRDSAPVSAQFTHFTPGGGAEAVGVTSEADATKAGDDASSREDESQAGATPLPEPTTDPHPSSTVATGDSGVTDGAEPPAPPSEEGVEVPLSPEDVRRRNTPDASAQDESIKVPSVVGSIEKAHYVLTQKEKIFRLPPRGTCPIQNPHDVLKVATPHRFVHIENPGSLRAKVSIWASPSDQTTPLTPAKRGTRTHAILAIYRGSEKPQSKESQAACVALNALCEGEPCPKPAEWPGLVGDNAIEIGAGESIMAYIGAPLVTSRGGFTLNVRTDQLNP